MTSKRPNIRSISLAETNQRNVNNNIYQLTSFVNNWSRIIGVSTTTSTATDSTLTIGASTNVLIANSGSILQTVGFTGGVSVWDFSSLTYGSGNAAGIAAFATRATTPSSNVLAHAGDTIGYHAFYGDDGVQPQQGALIQITVSTGVAANSMPASMVFLTSNIGATTPTQRLMLDDAGNIVANTGALAQSATNGFLYIATTTSSPTGTPSSFSGRVPMLYDTGNNKMWFYNGAWKGATFA